MFIPQSTRVPFSQRWTVEVVETSYTTIRGLDPSTSQDGEVREAIGGFPPSPLLRCCSRGSNRG
jgi:hypothetical protein